MKKKSFKGVQEWFIAKKHFLRYRVRGNLALLLVATGTGYGLASQEYLADYIDPFVGVKDKGSCAPGPLLPHSSIAPMPNTTGKGTCGYTWPQDIVGFAHTYSQGTGGVPSFGNFLVWPQTGPVLTSESQHASPKENESARAYHYSVKLTKWNIVAEVVPSSHSALYKFTFPASSEGCIAIDVSRKVYGELALKDGWVLVDTTKNSIKGGGKFANNWNPTPWDMYFVMQFSKNEFGAGTWSGGSTKNGQLKDSAHNGALGAYCQYSTTQDEIIYMKIAISFKSVAQAETWLANEIPGWDFDALKVGARNIWNKKMEKITISGASEVEKRRFYSDLFRAYVQPRDRSGDHGNWESAAPFWDDYYTMWDSRKTLFPLMTLIEPSMVKSNIAAFADRHAHNGFVAECFTQGKEYKSGQGGNEVDNIIGEAFLKGVPGVDWKEAWKVLKYHADSIRSPSYLTRGYACVDDKVPYAWRFKPADGTLSFSYNDYCAAHVAQGIGNEQDYQKYIARSSCWKNTWDTGFSYDGHKSFPHNRMISGSFQAQNGDGYNKDFYEGSYWVYSFAITHDVKGLIDITGGREAFVNRLEYALSNGKIDYSNEPSFQTAWFFCDEHVRLPHRSAFYTKKILALYPENGYPGDEDNGAMSSLRIFLAMGMYPWAGNARYYLHGPTLPKYELNLENGKTFTVIADNVSDENRYIQSATLNNAPLDNPWIHHNAILDGGTLVMKMGKTASSWGTGVSKKVHRPALGIPKDATEKRTVIVVNTRGQTVQRYEGHYLSLAETGLKSGLYYSYEKCNQDIIVRKRIHLSQLYLN